MGLFRRLSAAVFGSPAAAITPDSEFTSTQAAAAFAEAKSTTSRQPHSTGAHYAGGHTTTVLDDRDDDIDLVDLTDDAELTDTANTHPEPAKAVTPRPVPRNKQELFEELQRNYHEVTELVRKVDAHLDREEQRAQRVMQVVDRIDDLIPVLHSMPDVLNTKAEELNSRLIKVVEDNAGKGSAEIVSAVNRVTAEVRTGGEAQAELAHTMATFRQSMGDFATRTERSERVLKEISDSGERREAALATLVAKSRRTQLFAVAGAAAVGMAAIGAATALILLGA